jgi:plastocyanin
MRPHLAPTRLLATAAVAGLLVVGLGACGGDDSSSSTTTAGGETTTTGGGSSADDYVVVAKGTAFQNDLTVEPGEQFTLDNQDSATHTLTADDGSFDSGQVSGGTTSDPITPPTAPGTYKFHCEIHSSMHGTLTVK